ncbi:unnamed protein product [marine sediment metagenome]|uniref:Uncharacterized protein n=1 Tax=marine sediment metagenome TaxID=412755 RepID=X1NGL2_9ZZZZ
MMSEAGSTWENADSFWKQAYKAGLIEYSPTMPILGFFNPILRKYFLAVSTWFADSSISSTHVQSEAKCAASSISNRAPDFSS